MALKRTERIDPLLPIYLGEMIGAGKTILEYIAGNDLAGFVKNRILCDAVQHQFEILGEATTHVPYHVQRKYKKIPWSMMYSLRNHIAHEYFDIDYEIIWEIIKNDLPNDIQNLEHMLSENRNQV